MLNKVYTIKGISVIVVEDSSRSQTQSCESCRFLNYTNCPVNDKTHKGRDCLDGSYHYEDAPKKTTNTPQLYDPQKDADSIYRLEHGECHTISIGENTFAIHCLHTIVVLFYFDSCCGEYTYVRSFNKTTAGIAACIAVVEEHVNACETALAAENTKIVGEKSE